MTEHAAVESPGGGPTRNTPRGENVLVLAPSMDPAADGPCRTLVDGVDNLIVLSLTESPDRRVDAITAGGERPRNVVAVACDETRGATAGATSQTDSIPSCVTVGSPGDLTGIGMHVDRLLSQFAGDGETAVCVHSLTTLLQYGDAKAVFRFGHALTMKVREVGATAHFHLDPATVDDRTLRTVQSLFDRTIEI